MNDYLKIAAEYIRTEVGDDYAIVEESITDLNNFYCFTFQSKEFLDTKNFLSMAVGQGYYFIHKKDKRIFPYGSGLSFKEALTNIERSLFIEAEIRKHKNCFELRQRFDIKVNQIHNKQLLIDTLKKHAVTYIIPEIIGGSIFRIPKKYTNKVLEERFQELPATFRGVHTDTCLFLANELIQNDCCAFDLIPHMEAKQAVYTNVATPEDLKAIW